LNTVSIKCLFLSIFLIVASCIGNKLSCRELGWILGESVTFLLHDATAHGWVIPYHEIDRHSNDYIRFLSGSIRESAYSTISDSQRDAFHIMIGRKLWKGYNEHGTPSLLPKHQSLILRQMLLGVNAIVNNKERLALPIGCQ
jgi:hypothetical protein